MPAPAPRSYPASSPRASTPARCSSPRASTPASSGAGRPMAELTVELVRPAQAPGQPVIELTGAGRTSSTVSSAIGLPAPELAGVEALGELHLALSLIHISEPTRQAEISYAVF